MKLRGKDKGAVSLTHDLAVANAVSTKKQSKSAKSSSSTSSKSSTSVQSSDESAVRSDSSSDSSFTSSASKTKESASGDIRLSPPFSGSVRSVYQFFNKGATTLGVSPAINSIVDRIMQGFFLPASVGKPTWNTAVAKYPEASADLKLNTNMTPMPSKDSALRFHHEQSQICEIIREAITAPRSGAFVGKDIQCNKDFNKIAKRYKAMPEPHNELDLEPFNAVFSELMKTTVSMSFIRKININDQVEKALATSPELKQAFEKHRDELMAICVQEAFKTIPDAIGEVREAV
ncbi:MAG: hypothetical protein EOP06_31140, partial [Proteobacteria bacterium]